MSGAPAGGITALPAGVPGQEAARHRARDGVSVVAEDVVRRFGDRVVLDHLRLQIAASEFVVLLGPSGCGKTTLLRLLAGLDRPDGGTVSVPTARAIVLQGARLLPWHRVWQNVIIGLYGPDALARARVPDPALVLLDEPFAALDAMTRLRMHDLVRALRRRHSATILLVTHDVDEAIALADRILSVTALNSANRSSLSWLRAWCPVGILDGTILVYHFSQPPALTSVQEPPPRPAPLCPGPWSSAR